ncbi:GalNAc(5)-diNAcBac-PP-undecaprenol beta-1,3-glucosyltransferase [Methylophilaceae bacterium]|nr:GalNAc(5)-diNAcBac-PP-undecaprenol beta-1,3-glucosyltransferase [Methylophilaceae bacterium]
MSISIVIPTYNRADLLKRALKSVFNQTIRPDEIIISDNASTDHTQEVVRGFSNNGVNIKYFRHDKNVGMLKNWEHAVSLVDTSFFSVLADDDYLLPGFVEKGLVNLQGNSTLGMWSGITICVDHDLKPILLAPSNINAIKKYSNFDLLTFMLQHPASTGTIFNKKVFHRAGGFRTESAYLADLSIMLRVSAISEVMISNYPVAIYSASATYSQGHLFNTWYPGCLDIFEQLRRFDVSRHYAYKRYVGRTLYKSYVDIIKTPFNAPSLLKQKIGTFRMLFRYITPLAICFSFTEGFRVKYSAFLNKYNKSKLIRFCKSHNVEQKIKEANL